MRRNVIDSIVGNYTGDFGRGEGCSRTEDFGLLSLGRNMALEHMVTIDGYCTVCRRRRKKQTATTHRGNESVINSYIVESDTVVLRVGA